MWSQRMTKGEGVLTSGKIVVCTSLDYESCRGDRPYVVTSTTPRVSASRKKAEREKDPARATIPRLFLRFLSTDLPRNGFCHPGAASGEWVRERNAVIAPCVLRNGRKSQRLVEHPPCLSLFCSCCLAAASSQQERQLLASPCVLLLTIEVAERGRGRAACLLCFKDRI